MSKANEKKMPYIRFFADAWRIIQNTSDDTAGKILKAALRWVNGEELQLDGADIALYMSFQMQFERDMEKYLKQCEQGVHGKEGGRPKKNPKGLSKNPKGLRITQERQEQEQHQNIDNNNLYSDDSNNCEMCVDKVDNTDKERTDTQISENVASYYELLRHAGVYLSKTSEHDSLLEKYARSGFTVSMFDLAIYVAGDKKRFDFKYINGILENWRRAGYNSIEDIPESKQYRDVLTDMNDWENMRRRHT